MAEAGQNANVEKEGMLGLLGSWQKEAVRQQKPGVQGRKGLSRTCKPSRPGGGSNMNQHEHTGI